MKEEVSTQQPAPDASAMAPADQQQQAAPSAAVKTEEGAPAALPHKPLPRAAELLFANSTEQQKLYWDRSHYDSPESQMKALEKSSTLYIGNLAFSTRSYHVYSHFSQIGPVSRVIMGLDRFHHTPCGFCFVEYAHREDALLAVANLSSTKLDGRIIRVELDAGFQPGRQYGRGASGGQVRDERRSSQDSGRQHKRHKPLNWVPPPQQPPQDDNAMAAAPAEGAAEGDGAPVESGNSRFRDES